MSSNIQKRLLQLIIFLIPTNLALHWYLPQAQVYGKTIDYLLPKLYLSDIPVLILITTLLLNKRIYQLLKGIICNNKYQSFLLLTLVLLLFINGILSAHPVSSIWQLSKLIQLFLLVILVRIAWTPRQIIKLLFIPSLFALTFQSLLAVWQYLSQSQLFGYWFFGEPLLTSGFNLAKTNISGAIKILPYGTTPHPNVLAGSALIFFLMILGNYVYNPNSRIIKVLSIYSICLLLLLAGLTQSLSMLIAFVIVYYLLLKSDKRSKISILTNNRLVILSNIILLLIMAYITYQTLLSFDSSSIVRRYKLFQTTISLIINHPIQGVGLNNFISAAISQDTSKWFYTFPQPVHNIYLLWIAETGLLISIITFWLSRTFLTRLKGLKTQPHLVLPLIAILIIGLFDHYPLTLQPGLLLLSISLMTLPVTKSP